VLPCAIGRLSSFPSQTTPTYFPVAPTNQTSFGPELVPVLPTTLVKSSAARCAVPSVTTFCIIWFMPWATFSETSCAGSGSSRSRL